MKFNILLLVVVLAGCNRQDVTPESGTGSTAAAKPALKQVWPINLAKAAQPTSDPTVMKEYKRRLVYENRFLEAARKIAVKSNDQRIIEAYNYFMERHALSIPGKGGELQVEDPYDPTQLLRVVVLLPGDEKLGPPWSTLIKNIKAGGLFSSNDFSMILKPADAPSDETAGITFLHECFHAWETGTQGTKPLDAESFCLGELHAHEFERLVIQSIHPVTYDEVVEGAVRILARMGTDRSVTFQDVKSFIDQNLDRAYERKIQAGTEHGGLWNQVFFDANFRVLENSWPAEQWQREKVAFLKDWWERTGNAQWPH